MQNAGFMPAFCIRPAQIDIANSRCDSGPPKKGNCVLFPDYFFVESKVLEQAVICLTAIGFRRPYSQPYRLTNLVFRVCQTTAKNLNLLSMP